MAFRLFQRKQAEYTASVPLPVKVIAQPNEVYQALLTGLDEMEGQGVDRVVLSVYETEPSSNATGRWIREDGIAYYPRKTLTPTEQAMIADRKHYQVVALVMDNVGNLVKYPGRGVEVTQRTRVNPFLYRVSEDSPLRYVTECGAHTGENLRSYATIAAANGWTPEGVEQSVREGIQEYHGVTKRLMQSAGVDDVLQQMQQRAATPFESLMMQMRGNISQARSK
ncbi:hypothetical protein HYW21_01575 [Candidatus Woesearchaeota archaeon]|nr:hypothetical protein [Candidatus Woesearchaeota archaeon]